MDHAEKRAEIMHILNLKPDDFCPVCWSKVKRILDFCADETESNARMAAELVEREGWTA